MFYKYKKTSSKEDFIISRHFLFYNRVRVTKKIKNSGLLVRIQDSNKAKTAQSNEN